MWFYTRVPVFCYIMNYQKRKKKLERQIKFWQKEKQLIFLRQDLSKDKKDTHNRLKKQRKKTTTTKLLMLFLFISCSAIEFFTIFLTFKGLMLGFLDFSALQSLITAVVAQVVGFAIYSLKSVKENTKGGIIYQTAMLDRQVEQDQKENNYQEAQG